MALPRLDLDPHRPTRHLPDLLRAALEDGQRAARRQAPGGAPLNLRDQAFLRRVDAVVDRHFADCGFGTAHLAERLGLSERHLRRRVSALTGETPGVRLRRRRIEVGVALLGTGAYTVARVAAAVGYGGAEGFRRAFVSLRGHQPSQVFRGGVPPNEAPTNA